MQLGSESKETRTTPTSKPKSKQKRRGIYYTPDALSDLLATWGIRKDSDRVLEPSFGGCGFIGASAKRLRELGARRPLGQIRGCDIDSRAFRHLAELDATLGANGQFVHGDFLALKPGDWGGANFDCVIGNPPYVSHHNMFAKQRRAASAVACDSRFRVSGMASLWAYFVFHSLRFMKPDGRMAWVLPASAIQTEYGRSLLRELACRFQRVRLISLRERMFRDYQIDEKSELLFAEGFLGEVRAQDLVQLGSAGSIDDLKQMLNTDPPCEFAAMPGSESARVNLPVEARKAYYELVGQQLAKPIRDLAVLRIGMVTGANWFFVMTPSQIEHFRIPQSAFRPVLGRFSLISGLSYTHADVAASVRKDERCMLLHVEGKPSKLTNNYLKRFPQHVRKRNCTFAKRAIWHAPDDGKVPDAFFPYMNHLGPRIVMNVAGVNCVNSVHRVFFRVNLSDEERKLIALTSLSSFTQLSAELSGRVYASGVLKFEIQEASSLRLLLPAISKAEVTKVTVVEKKVEGLLRNGKASAATDVVDSFLSELLEARGISYSVDSIREGVRMLRELRLKSRANE